MMKRKAFMVGFVLLTPSCQTTQSLDWSLDECSYMPEFIELSEFSGKEIRLEFEAQVPSQIQFPAICLGPEGSLAWTLSPVSGGPSIAQGLVEPSQPSRPFPQGHYQLTVELKGPHPTRLVPPKVEGIDGVEVPLIVSERSSPLDEAVTPRYRPRKMLSRPDESSPPQDGNEPTR